MSCSTPGVRIVPGVTVLTVAPSRTSSSASARVIDSTAPFVAL
jgi:hypothetical protein